MLLKTNSVAFNCTRPFFLILHMIRKYDTVPGCLSHTPSLTFFFRLLAPSVATSSEQLAKDVDHKQHSIIHLRRCSWIMVLIGQGHQQLLARPDFFVTFSFVYHLSFIQRPNWSSIFSVASWCFFSLTYQNSPHLTCSATPVLKISLCLNLQPCSSTYRLYNIDSPYSSSTFYRCSKLLATLWTFESMPTALPLRQSAKCLCCTLRTNRRKGRYVSCERSD